MTPRKKRPVELINAKLPRYAGKALRPGQPFHASEKDARMLTAAKLATYATADQARRPAVAKAPEPAPHPDADAAELAALRADYEALTEKKPLGFWKADKLRAEIEKARAARDASPTGDVSGDASEGDETATGK